jgi:hypothetical protein
LVTDNVWVRRRRWVRGRGWAAALAVSSALAAVSACSGGSLPAPTGTASLTARPADRDALAALAAAAKDRRYVATYTLAASGRPDRIVTVAIATDGSWVVAVPAGALSGLADIAIFSSGDGLFQCALGPAAGTTGSRLDLQPVTPGCVRVRRLTTETDPRVQHLFTDWIDTLVDRAAALSVAAAPPLPGARGECYSVESNSAALAPPVDPGIYCYDHDGTLTAARTRFGTLILAGAVAAGPPAVAQPGATVSRAPLPVRAPPPPPPSASATPAAAGLGYQ